MKKYLAIILSMAMLFSLAACGGEAQVSPSPEAETPVKEHVPEIVLSDEGITVDGEPISTDPASAVYAANDIIYYEEGHDFTYGEGTEADAHSAEEAAAHTVVHITKAGPYTISGKLSAGQIAVDLGEDAEDDPNAVVSLILNGVDITCTVAPAVIFYNVYECGDKDDPTMDVDTSDAGALVYLEEGSNNIVNGSYVARIYKPDSVVLSADGTEVEDAKKLHKYDGAFYSRMSMNIGAASDVSGKLTIIAENEGLDSEMHLTINGGLIDIKSGNDGINTNEDGVSVTTINGGQVQIQVTGETGEGDGIDSNGWLVINGGAVIAAAYGQSADSGIDSDMGIHINGGTVIATGNMLDRIEDGGQTHAVFTFAQSQKAGTNYSLKEGEGTEVYSFTPDNDFSMLIFSSPDLEPGDYTLWQGDAQLQHGGVSFGGGGFGGGMMPGGPRVPEEWEDIDFSQLPEIPEMPEGFEPGQMPEGMEPPEGFDPNAQRPERPEMPEGAMPQGGGPGGGRGPGGRGPGGMNMEDVEMSSTFTIAEGANYFSGISAVSE